MYSEQVHLAVEGLEGSLTTDFDGLRIYPRLTTFPSLCQCVSSKEIQPVEELQWTQQRVGLGLKSGLGAGLFCGLIGWETFGLNIGLISGLSFGLLLGLSFVLTNTGVEVTTVPNQGIWNSAKNSIYVGLISGICVGLIAGFVRGLNVGMSSGLIAGLFGLIFYGGDTCIRHFTLHLTLYRFSYIPWNYARFLDYAVERLFLHRVGGGYIFIHRMLLEHFAAMDLKPSKRW
jgi:eukaryotic-like serine/threonine-protein kinase